MEPFALVDVPTDELCAEARALREQGTGTLVTYSPKVFIPLTKLCRDVCHYCTFARPPRRGERAYMSLDEVLAVAGAGAAAGCHEALFTLGDKPELRYRAAREELATLGCETTLDYLERAARTVLEGTGLLPHLNPGVMDAADLARLRRVSASQGIMLESSSERLSARGGPHFGSPDKLPARRLETLRLAGEAAVPFTTGILIGIGETRQERIESLLAIRELGECHGHVQEVIVQNFRAKPGTRMAGHPEPSLDELLWTAAAARVLLGSRWNIQAPPNLSYDEFPRLLDAGINDWGGISPVTVDHVNPEAPWPEVERLRQATEARGLRLAPRLPIYPEYVADLERWADPAVVAAVLRRADADGLGREDRWAAGSPETPSAAGVATNLLPTASLTRKPVRVGAGSRPKVSPPIAQALAKSRAEDELDETDVTALLQARGPDLEAVLRAADDLRREVSGDTVTYVVTRNINYTNVCYFRCGFCAFSKGKLAEDLRGRPYLVPMDEIVRRSREAWERGGVEVCLQGGIHPAFTGDFYLDVCRAIKGALPDIHVHAFSALEVWQGATTLELTLDEYVTRLRAAGLASLPGTAAEILDDEVRWALTKGKLPADTWEEIVRTAHGLGIRSSSTIMFGHVDAPPHWVGHLRRLARIQADTGGFTEFVPLPFVHQHAPIYLAGKARPGATSAEQLRMHAVARILLDGLIENIQVSWVKMGVEACQSVLRSGANDFGGTLMEETISRMAGAEWGIEMTPDQFDDAIRAIGRTPVVRTTTYERVERARARS